ncbi:MAG: hypothetical protein HZB92_08350 [Euryarchaeota archaeon]|nr:hypothetical protein [Euryarchaeota archaeon]
MEIGEPVLPENQQWPEVFQAIQAVQALGHEARLMVVDWTRYRKVYPFMWPVDPEDED